MKKPCQECSFEISCQTKHSCNECEFKRDCIGDKCFKFSKKKKGVTID